MGMFDEPGARGTGGLDPQKAGKVGSEVIKQVGVGARALFGALPLIPHFQFDSGLPTFQRPSASLFIGARAR